MFCERGVSQLRSILGKKDMEGKEKPKICSFFVQKFFKKNRSRKIKQRRHDIEHVEK